MKQLIWLVLVLMILVPKAEWDKLTDQQREGRVNEMAKVYKGKNPSCITVEVKGEENGDKVVFTFKCLGKGAEL